MRISSTCVLVFLFIVAASETLQAQHLFTTAETSGFGSPALLFGFSRTTLDEGLGEDFTLLTARVSIGIGKTDLFGSFDGVLADDVFDTNFTAWSAGVKHQFLRAHLVHIGGIVRIRGNRGTEDRFEDALLDFAGIISIETPHFQPYYALLYTRPLGFDLSDEFQRTSVFGAEVPIGDIPRVLGEFSFGDRSSFGVALKLQF